jgi:hypothetical protein
MDPKRTRLARGALATLSGFIALWAVAGAAGLAGGGLDLGDSVDARLPMHSPVLAGILLALIVAVPMGITTVAVVRADRRSSAGAMAAGALLVGWILVQPAIIGRFDWLQPVFGLLGSSVFALGLLLQPRVSRRVGD